MKLYLTAALLLIFSLGASAQAKTVRAGKHLFSIQYIGFNNVSPGTVVIKSLGSDEYSIEGEQRDKLKNEYVTINGTFLAVGRELKFNGKIVSRIGYVNNGQPCERNGLVVFKASGKRKYWRLQQMLDCDGVSTDYIDIFF